MKMRSIDRVVYNNTMWGLRKGRKNKEKRKPDTGEHDSGNFRLLNAIARQLRKQKAELVELRTEISILKRDLSRIDRRGYREEALYKVKPRISKKEVSSDGPDDFAWIEGVK